MGSMQTQNFSKRLCEDARDETRNEEPSVVTIDTNIRENLHRKPEITHDEVKDKHCLFAEDPAIIDRGKGTNLSA